MRSCLAVLLLTLAAGCRQQQLAAEPPPPPPVPAHTTLDPPPGPFNDTVEVTLTTDKLATIFVTTDGSDPQVDGKARVSGPSPLKLTLSSTTNLRLYSHTPEGADESESSASYVRAGGKKGSISGVVVVGGVALGHDVALLQDGKPLALGKPAAAAELPFTIEGLESGPHRLVAMADRDGDMKFVPILDFASATQTVTLDLNDPFKASAEGVRLYLGASQPGLCTIEGTITFERPTPGQNLSVSALDPSSLQGAAAQGILTQLAQGYRVFTNETDTKYRYVLTDLEPGRYVVVPFITGLGTGGVATNLLANPLQTINCTDKAPTTFDAKFGPTALSGTVTVTPKTAPMGFTWGIVAARSVSFTSGVEAVLMPALFTPGTGSTLQAGYAGVALKSGAPFDLRVFTSLDPADPLTSALAWVMNPFAAEKPHLSITTAGNTQQADITVP